MKAAVAGAACVLVGLALMTDRMPPDVGSDELAIEPALETAAIDAAPLEVELAALNAPNVDPMLDRMEQEVADDPIAQQVPMLSYATEEMQLETLRWLQHVPEDKVVAAIPALLAERHIPMSVREEMARAMVGDMIRDLEDQGVSAPRMKAGAAVARLTSSVREPFLAPLGGGSDRDPGR